MPASRIIELRNNGEIHLYEGSNGAQKVTLKAPASLAADLTFQLPDVAGTSGQFLQTNGSGVLAWASGTSTLQQAYDASSPPTITIPAAGSPLILNRTDSGDYLRLNDAGAEVFNIRRTGTAMIVGTTSPSWDLFLEANSTITLLVQASTGNVSIGALSPEARLDVQGGDVLVDNNKYYSAEAVAGTNRTLLGINASDNVLVGNSLQAGELQLVLSDTRSVVIGGSIPTLTGRLEVCKPATDVSVVVRNLNADALNDVQRLIFTTGTAAAGDGTQTGELKANVNQGGASPLMSELFLRINAGDLMQDAFSLLYTTDQSRSVMSHFGFRGSRTRLMQKDVLVATSAGTTVDTVNFFTAGMVIVGLTARVVTSITGAANISIGDQTTAALYLTNGTKLTAAQTYILPNGEGSQNGSMTTSKYITGTGDTTLRITGNVAFTGGSIRVVAHYYDLIPPTS